MKRLLAFTLFGGVAVLTLASTVPAVANATVYRSCDEAIRAGVAPMYLGDPAYSPALDRDGDGIACEQGTANGPATTGAPAPIASLKPVPGMVSGAVLGDHCTNYELFIFGSTSAGDPLACVAFGGPDGQWVSSAPLQGTQQIGAPCTNGAGGGAAQTTDGQPLVCVDGINGPGGGWQPGP